MKQMFTYLRLYTILIGIAFLLPQFATGQTVCGTTWYDTGGPNGPYGGNANNTTTFCPDNEGDLVTVTFTFFETEAFWDKLYVYDGPNTSSPQISSGNPAGSGPCSTTGGFWGNLNNNLPGPFVSSHSSGCLTFNFCSDPIFNFPGWAANITCAPQPNCTPPVMEFVQGERDCDNLNFSVTATVDAPSPGAAPLLLVTASADGATLPGVGGVINNAPGASIEVLNLPLDVDVQVEVNVLGFSCPISAIYNVSSEGCPCPDLGLSVGDNCINDEGFGQVSPTCECVEIDFDGCTNGVAFGAAAPTCDNPNATVPGVWNGEFSNITVLNGGSYTFSTSVVAAVPTFYITITNATATEVLSVGINSATWNSTFNGQVRFYTHAQADCGGLTGGASSHTRFINLVCDNVIFDCEDLEANIGDECTPSGGGQGQVNAECECIELLCPALAPTCVVTSSAAYTTVIDNDPFCCNNSWDFICQNAYDALSGSCTGGPGPTCTAVAPPCVDLLSTAYTSVVLNDPFCCNTSWDLSCQNAYDALSSTCTGGGGDCAAIPPACVITGSTAYSNVIASDPFCCDTQWDFACQDAYDALSTSCNGGGGGDCPIAPPACVDTESSAYASVIAGDPFCCDFGWDLLCQGDYDALSSTCTGGGTDCVTEIPDCVDIQSTAFTLTIQEDSFCCDFAWDDFCQFLYDSQSETCTGGGNDCPAEIPACVDTQSSAFTETILEDSFCCDFEWDDFCQFIYDNLSTSCTGGGSDCAAETPPCVDTQSSAYTETILADSFCCDFEWDNFCQTAYDSLSDSCDEGSTDCVAETPVCVDTESDAYATVVANDSFCCDNSWDLICQNAYDALSDSCDGGTTDCIAETPACVDTESDAYITVVSNDPFCCDNMWDTVCQSAYDELNDSCIPVPTIFDIVEASEVHNTLETALLEAGLDGALSNPEDALTLFAPTDAAFEALPDGLLADLLADPSGLLTDILLYHVVGSVALSTDLADGQMITTQLGEDVTVTINGDGVFINDAQVIIADILASNGVVHVIDAVLVPAEEELPTIFDIVEASEVHNTLETALLEAGLDGALSNPEDALTLFAPTDAAFEALPDGLLADLLADPSGLLTDILLYHVVGSVALSTDLADGQMITTLLGEDVTVTINGDGVFINDAQVIIADILASNGVVHVIDAVLVPAEEELPTIFDIVEASEVHNTLETALLEAGLDGALSNPEDALTLFAPTDAAFEALPDGLLADLLADPSGLLTDILLYHVVGSVALSTDLADGQMITTLLGEDVTVTINGDGVFINDAQVIIADILASNGVVHVIDAVLVPAEEELPTIFDIVEASEVHNTLETALLEAGLDGALSNPEDALTLFAPTDAAFEALPAGVLADLLADPSGLLTDILLYHVVGSVALSTDLADGQMITTLLGEDVTVTINGDGVFINDAQVIIADLLASNGVVHVIDAVLVPAEEELPTIFDIVEASEVHNTLETALLEAGLDGALSNPEDALTLFAPTDEAFEALPDGLLADLLADPSGLLTDILLYHVVGSVALSTDLADGQMITTLLGEDVTVTINGDGVFINDAQVIIADLLASNGVVHVIDAVLLPPVEELPTIFDIVAASEVHNTLETALLEAGLDGALSNPEDALTLFAPTDEAFEALPDGLLADLLADPSGLLTDILLYHVVGSVALSTDLADGQEITTLLGLDVVVTINGDGVFINDAQVIIADILASNGVVHVIDAVLVPEFDEPSACENATAITAQPTFAESEFFTSMLGETASGVEQCTNADNEQPDQWFSFESVATVMYIRGWGLEDFDAAVEVYNACGDEVSVCQNDEPAGEREIVILTNTTPGETYYFRVYHGGAGTPGNLDYSVAVAHIPFTKLMEEDCEVFDYTPADIIRTELPPNQFLLSNWYFEFTELEAPFNTYEILSLNGSNPNFKLEWFPQAEYGRTYSVRTRAKMYQGPNWGDYGDACTIGFSATPLTTQLKEELALGFYDMCDILEADNVPGAQAYRWRIMDGFNVIIYTTPNRFLPLQDVPGLNLGSPYAVRVRAYTLGQWSPFGLVRLFAMNNFVPETGVDTNINTCGATYPLSQVLSAVEICAAEFYTWRFTNVSDATQPDLFYTRDDGLRTIQLTWVDGLIPGDTYSVQVLGGSGGLTGTYGYACEITIAGGSAGLVTQPDVLTDQLTQYSVNLYPNPSRGDEVMITVDNLTDAQNEFIIEVYDIYGKKVHSENFANNGSSLIAAVNFQKPMAAGIYTVNIISNDELIGARKLVVQK
jgi:transforming growth factor-beta-induced protein